MGRPFWEILQYTYREHEFFWERYLHQQQFEIDLQIKLNPWIEQDKSSENTVEIDWTNENAETALAAAGIPVTKRRIKPKSE